MGNTFVVSASDEKVPFVECREQGGIEVDRPHAAVRLLEADPLIDERVGDIAQVLLEAERAGIRHMLHHEVARILRHGEPRWIRARRRCVATGRRLLEERLVRPFGVVLELDTEMIGLCRTSLPLEFIADRADADDTGSDLSDASALGQLLGEIRSGFGESRLRIAIAVIGLVAIFGCGDRERGFRTPAATPGPSHATRELQPQDIARTSMPSVVVLTMRDASGQPLSLGSGFVVAENLIATNYHVINGATSGSGKGLGDTANTSLDGVAAADPDHDVALVVMRTPRRPLVLRANNDEINIGERLFAIGHPEGLEGTFSEGILSAIRVFGQDTILQLTTPISPGSSGGPVLDAQGRVVGVATATFREGQNLNFAVPALYIERLLGRGAKVTPFSASVPRKRPSFAARFGERNATGVVGENFQWEGVFDFESGYTFSLRNKLSDAIQSVVCLVVFYDRNGNPVESDFVQSYGVIGPGLAQRVASKVDPSVKRITTDKSGYLQYSYRPSTRIDFRVLDFKIAK